MLTLNLKSLVKTGKSAPKSGLIVGTRTGFGYWGTSHQMAVHVSMRHGNCSADLPEPDSRSVLAVQDTVGNSNGIRAGRSAARSCAAVFCPSSSAFSQAGRVAKGGCFQAVAVGIDPAKVRATAPAGVKQLGLLSERLRVSRYQASRIPPRVVTKD